MFRQLKPGTVLAIGIVLLMLVQIVPVMAAPAPSSYRVIIGYSGDPSQAKLAAKAAGFKILRELDAFNAIVVEVKGVSPGDAVEKARKGFEQHAKVRGIGIRYVEPDRKLYAFALSDSPDIQWDIFMVNAPTVWDTYYPYVGDYALGYGVQVAVLDTGIDYTHPELYGKVVWCVNTADYPWIVVSSNPWYCRDVNGHGTHVAGTIAAALDGTGVAGVAPAVTLYAIKVLSNSGSGYISDIAYGIYYAVAGPDGVVGTWDDAEVLSMSLGGPTDDPLLSDATYWAYQNGAIIVAAAGNEGDGDPTTDEVAYPAKYPWVIAVAAVDANGDSPTWSSEGPEVDVAAPGVDILSTYPRGDYAVLSGTSMATPHVSGVVALIQALRIASGKAPLTFEEVYDALTTTAIDLGPAGFDNFTGYGLVDAYAAVNYALQLP
ncbi:Subtilisin-like serine protease [Pyrodictium delaneyi]|uniref:Subtilisin-like serine protease n=1 Tax=Pyrodictium delaneyi TaxID=1273541 RepID=A0A0P0N2G0_9CREN|nr:S8 family peptidase [Pyrodictium delaneyi]ALL00667.1 Subtilisin-like serine protease [Pyrodictium delaneyi]